MLKIQRFNRKTHGFRTFSHFGPNIWNNTRMLKIQRFNRKTHGFRTFSHFGPNIWNNLPQDIRHSATLSSFKSHLKRLLRIFQLNHFISLYSVCGGGGGARACVRVCVCIFCIIMLEHLSIYTFLFYFLIAFYISMYIIVCMLVQRIEPQGRRFTNFHYYYSAV